MSQATQEKNKALVLEAFDTLFNRRDYAAAERFWSPDYIQHSAHIAPGREGLFNLVRSLPSTLKYEPGVIVADGDFVDRPWPVLRVRGARELDRRGHPPPRGRGSRRALGRDPGRGDPRAVQERPADVRQLISRAPLSTLSAVTRVLKRNEQTKRKSRRSNRALAEVQP